MRFLHGHCFRRLAAVCLGAAFSIALFAEPPEGSGKWKLVFEDDFNYPNAELDREWVSQNGPSGHILSSRWRENAVVENGILKLLAKKEKRANQEWTAASIWTKKLFKYGYFECRYKYAAATGTNNSFWLMTQGWQKVVESDNSKKFEIDINEGHYPDEINVNLHNWSDFWIDEKTGKKRHGAWGKTVCLSPKTGRADREIILDVPLRTSRLRFSSKEPGFFHLRELRAFPKSDDGKYPGIISNKNDADFEYLTNYAKGAKITASNGAYDKYPDKVPAYAVDGKPLTSWITSPAEEKFLELDFGEEREIGCVQLLTGWPRDGVYVAYIHQYRLEYWDGQGWVEFSKLYNDRIHTADLSKDFHTYALEWDGDWLVYYFDGREIHRRKNDICHWESPVLLSLAITHFAGAVTDAADGTSMDVDYVKIWQRDDGKSTVGEKPQGKPAK